MQGDNQDVKELKGEQTCTEAGTLFEVMQGLEEGWVVVHSSSLCHRKQSV